MIGVVIPAHNEEALLSACLRSVRIASHVSSLEGESVCVVVALDRCTDGTAAIARAWEAHTVHLDDGNVGLARATGSEYALSLGARWLAMTDADSTVPPDWLSSPLTYEADAFCGIVQVGDWLDYPDAMAEAFRTPHSVSDGHPHVHGANMAVSAEWYRRVGGFQPVTVSEDVALIQAIDVAGGTIARRARPIVTTSARRDARATGGFGDYLRVMEEKLLNLPARTI